MSTSGGQASFSDGPFGPNGTYQIGCYGAGITDFGFNVPNSLITGPPPIAPVQFDPTGNGQNGGWEALVGGADYNTPFGATVTGGYLTPAAAPTPLPATLLLFGPGLFGLASIRRRLGK
jgi:hypothetical protein